MIAAGARILAQTCSGNDAALIAIEKETLLADGTVASGRRVQLPWGAGSLFDFNELTCDDLTLITRAIDWAACRDVVVSVGIALKSRNNTAPVMETKVGVTNRPAVPSVP